MKCLQSRDLEMHAINSWLKVHLTYCNKFDSKFFFARMKKQNHLQNIIVRTKVGEAIEKIETKVKKHKDKIQTFLVTESTLNVLSIS